MSRKIVLEKTMTCNELEKAMGLNKGQILSITISSDGNNIEIEFADSVVWPDPVLARKLQDALNLHVKPGV